MTKKKQAARAKRSTKKATGSSKDKKVRQARPETATDAKKPAPKEDLVVFAFRLTHEERDVIHKAAGPGKASRFVRTLAVAAAQGDEAGMLGLLKKDGGAKQ